MLRTAKLFERRAPERIDDARRIQFEHGLASGGIEREPVAVRLRGRLEPAPRRSDAGAPTDRSRRTTRPAPPAGGSNCALRAARVLAARPLQQHRLKARPVVSASCCPSMSSIDLRQRRIERKRLHAESESTCRGCRRGKTRRGSARRAGTARARRAACPRGGVPARHCQTGPLVSTSAARFFWKKSSIRPPGAKSLPKSSAATSRVEARTNG